MVMMKEEMVVNGKGEDGDDEGGDGSKWER